MAGPFGLREDLYNVTIILAGTDGQKVKFVFDKMSGGKITTKVTKYRAANGTEDEQVLGGAKVVDDITVLGLMTYDMYLWLPWMIAQAGKADAYVNKQPVDRDGNAFGKALNYSGKLQDVEPPATDSHSDNAALLGLTFSVTTSAGTIQTG
jgi:hypothetical protein